ncbi:hypothetical protein ACEWY4_015223 [Coilia grayii]|uniref:Ig-like domain-containing protein n=1 Tax=Coilia grayii TaxID=363190 RepID=A0ABD1JME4_9TELE
MSILSIYAFHFYNNLGTISAAGGGDDLEEKIVHVGDPVTLSCDVGDKVRVDSSEIKWTTYGDTVVKLVNATLTSDCGYEGRVQMSESIERGNVSLTIHRTVFNDYGEYECHYNKEHKKTWSLKITANIPKELTVTPGHPVWIPCYTREKTCTDNRRNADKGRTTNGTSFTWTKDNETVLQIVKGGRESKGRAQVSYDIDNGNLSLVFAQAYFSDRGNYSCTKQEDRTFLTLRVHQEEIKVSLEESEAFLSLRLYTVDPVNVYFQKDNSSTPVLVCGNYTCSQSWKYVESGHKVELDAVTRDDLGTYAVRDRSRDELLCTYIVSMAVLNGRHTQQSALVILIVFLLLILIIYCIFKECIEGEVI